MTKVLKTPIENKDAAITDAITIARRRMATGSEQQTLREGAAAIVAAGGPQTDEQRRVMAMVDAMTLTPPSDDRPTPPVQLLRAIDEATAIVADFQNSQNTALEAVVTARAQAAKRPSAQATQGVRDAEEAYCIAREATSRAGRTRRRALDALDAWRRQQASEEHGTRRTEK